MKLWPGVSVRVRVSMWTRVHGRCPQSSHPITRPLRQDSGEGVQGRRPRNSDLAAMHQRSSLSLGP